MNESSDLRPDHVQLRNVFRQIQPSYLVAAGCNTFLEDLVQLLDLPDDTNINKYKVPRAKTSNANASNVCFFPFNRTGLLEGYRKRIYCLDLPGIPAMSSENNRKIFIDSALPMSQELAVIAIGNLLKYLHENALKWRHVFLNLDGKPIITNVVVIQVESQVWFLGSLTFSQP